MGFADEIVVTVREAGYFDLDDKFALAAAIDAYNAAIQIDNAAATKAQQNPKPEPFQFMPGKHGRNDPCPCGSGKKYKKCCIQKNEEARRAAAVSKRRQFIGRIDPLTIPVTHNPDSLTEDMLLLERLLRSDEALSSVSFDRVKLHEFMKANVDALQKPGEEEPTEAFRDIAELSQQYFVTHESPQFAQALRESLLSAATRVNMPPEKRALALGLLDIPNVEKQSAPTILVILIFLRDIAACADCETMARRLLGPAKSVRIESAIRVLRNTFTKYHELRDFIDNEPEFELVLPLPTALRMMNHLSKTCPSIFDSDEWMDEAEPFYEKLSEQDYRLYEQVFEQLQAKYDKNEDQNEELTYMMDILGHLIAERNIEPVWKSLAAMTVQNFEELFSDEGYYPIEWAGEPENLSLDELFKGLPARLRAAGHNQLADHAEKDLEDWEDLVKWLNAQ